MLLHVRTVRKMLLWCIRRRPRRLCTWRSGRREVRLRTVRAVVRNLLRERMRCVRDLQVLHVRHISSTMALHNLLVEFMLTELARISRVIQFMLWMLGTDEFSSCSIRNERCSRSGEDCSTPTTQGHGVIRVCGIGAVVLPPSPSYATQAIHLVAWRNSLNVCSCFLHCRGSERKDILLVTECIGDFSFPVAHGGYDWRML